MELGLDVRQAQTLSPQMVQSMEILQMGSQELLEYIEEVMQENPVLESEDPAWEEDISQLRRKLEWLESTDVQNSYYHRQDADERRSALDNAAGDAMEENLYYYLKSQVRFERLPREMGRTLDYLMESLNGNGWLDDPQDDVAARLGVPPETVREAVRLLQSLDPAGVGARDLRECLRLQLQRRGEGGLAMEIVENYLEDLGRDRYNLIARRTGATRAQVQEACARIRALNPRPASGFANRENLHYLIPDLIVVNFADHFELLTNDAYLPSLRLNGYYTRLYHETEDRKVKEYLNGRLRQANWIMKGVEQRRSTLMRCAQCLVDKQEDFFRLGPGHLRPMLLSDVAEELGVHESTVSRAVREKYIQCAHGLFPLGYFFSRALGTSGGEGVAPERAKRLLRDLIGGEDKRKPLSDQKLALLLAGQGVEISRRTVAKYRSEMGIASTAGRKVFEEPSAP